MIYIPNLLKICSGIQKLMGGRFTKTQHGDLTSLLLFFKNKENMLKILNS
jgi:hypothetical protein